QEGGGVAARVDEHGVDAAAIGGDRHRGVEADVLGAVGRDDRQVRRRRRRGAGGTGGRGSAWGGARGGARGGAGDQGDRAGRCQDEGGQRTGKAGGLGHSAGTYHCFWAHRRAAILAITSATRTSGARLLLHNP